MGHVSALKRWLVMGILAAMPAKAGTLLHLRSGEVETAKTSAQMTNLSQQTHYFIVQFKEAITAQDQAWLGEQGFQVDHYIPDDALLVRAPGTEASVLRKQGRVQAVLPLTPSWKLSPELQKTVQKKRVLVRLSPSADRDEVRAHVRALSSVRLISAQGGTLVVDTENSLLPLAAIDGVLWLQPLVPMQLMMQPMDASVAQPPSGHYSELTGKESGTQLMNFKPAWERNLTGRHQIVAAADTGLDTGDRGTLFADFKELDEAHTFGFLTSSWADPVGHGTHVSGSILGSGSGSGGVIQGGAYQAKLIIQGMWSTLIGGLSIPPDVTQFLDRAYLRGARIHSDSWGSAKEFGLYDAFASQVDEYAWTHPDLLIVFAAGNSGEDRNRDGRVDAGSISSPATAKNVLTVGASENEVQHGGIQVHVSRLKMGGEKWSAEPLASDLLSNNVKGLAAFSARGPTLDGRLKPEVVAPGTNILSNCSHLKEADSPWGRFNDDYCFGGGTSMATPLVAGAAAVIRQYFIEELGFIAPSAALLKNALMHTASDLYPGQFGEIGEARGQELLTHRPDSNQGFGRINVGRAVQLDSALIVDDKKGLSQGEHRTFQLRVDEERSLTATLVYTDAPGAPNAAISLVNDLDLELKGPNGLKATAKSTINNWEMIELDHLPAGVYRITVKARRVPQPRNQGQSYSLIASQH